MTTTIATKPRPSSIRIFLAEGSPTGLRIVEKFNWVGRGIVFPRSGYAEAKLRPELMKAGVYVMSGPSETTGRERVYIGQGDSVRPRLDRHLVEKDFWTQGFVFTSKDDNLNTAHVQYLEARLYELASDAKRAELDNLNRPTRPGLSEVDQAEIETFLAEMLVCFPVLGLSAFENPLEQSATSLVFSARGPRTDARGFESDEGFVVRSGAVVSSTEAGGTPAFVSALRRQLLDDGVIDNKSEKWVLAQDFVFSSPSTAAAVVLGRNANGRVEWKDERGRTLKQVQEEEG